MEREIEELSGQKANKRTCQSCHNELIYLTCCGVHSENKLYIDIIITEHANNLKRSHNFEVGKDPNHKVRSNVFCKPTQ